MDLYETWEFWTSPIIWIPLKSGDMLTAFQVENSHEYLKYFA